MKQAELFFSLKVATNCDGQLTFVILCILCIYVTKLQEVRLDFDVIEVGYINNKLATRVTFTE